LIRNFGATAVVVAGTALSELCNWQQGCAALIVAIPSFIVIDLQQEWQGAGAIQASAGAAAQRAATVSITIAPTLPIRLV